MYKNIFFILILIATLLLQGCESLLENPEPVERKTETYTKYTYIPATKKEFLLNESFTNNSNSWKVVTNSSQYQVQIVDGNLKMRSNYSNDVQSTINLNNFNTTGNFEIEAYLQILYIDKSSENGNMLVWGFQNTATQYKFLKVYNNNEKWFSIGNFDGKNTYADYFYNDYDIDYGGQGYYNKYTIRKIGNQYYYFINETFLYQENFSSFSGNQIGFQAGGNNSISVDWLTVKKLNI